jgi:hypothetical protein
MQQPFARLAPVLLALLLAGSASVPQGEALILPRTKPKLFKKGDELSGMPRLTHVPGRVLSGCRRGQDTRKVDENWLHG